MALKKGINIRHGMQFGEPGATSASELAYDANTTTKEKIDSKQDTLTFDNVPTNGSNNPVKSDGIYDALAGKQDIFERISYADWQLLSPQQQAAKPYYIYDYPSTQITAANVSYDHTQSGLSATTAQGGIDELASEKQDKTDNSLQTTQKDIVPAINEIKSGLTGKQNIYDSATKLGEIAADATVLGVTATKDGYLSVVYEMLATDRNITGRIRDNDIPQLGASFNITATAYAGEPICTIPCRNGRTYGVVVSAGHGGVSIYQL